MAAALNQKWRPSAALVAPPPPKKRKGSAFWLGETKCPKKHCNTLSRESLETTGMTTGFANAPKSAQVSSKAEGTKCPPGQLDLAGRESGSLPESVQMPLHPHPGRSDPVKSGMFHDARDPSVWKPPCRPPRGTSVKSTKLRARHMPKKKVNPSSPMMLYCSCFTTIMTLKTKSPHLSSKECVTPKTSPPPQKKSGDKINTTCFKMPLCGQEIVKGRIWYHENFSRLNNKSMNVPLKIFSSNYSKVSQQDEEKKKKSQ